MNHKEYMKYLKENDPITYSEMTSDPTGAGDSSGGFWVELLLIVGIISAIFYFL